MNLETGTQENLGVNNQELNMFFSINEIVAVIKKLRNKWVVSKEGMQLHSLVLLLPSHSRKNAWMNQFLWSPLYGYFMMVASKIKKSIVVGGMSLG